MNRPDLPVIVLAAGQSRRMRGRDKLLEPVEGEPLIRRQALLALAATSGPVIVALPPAPHPRHEALSDLGIVRVPVPDAGEGMNASLRRAFAALPPTASAAMLLLADLPDLTVADLMAVSAAVAEQPDMLVWRGATQDGRPGHPVVFSARSFGAIKRLRGDTGGREIVAEAGDRVALIALPGNHARADLDTPEDWAAWRLGRETAADT